MLRYLVLVSAIVVVRATVDQYSVPVPTIEVYSPKGVRIAIPDDAQIDTVDFFLSFSNPNPDSGEYQKVTSEGGYWIYWNPSLALKPGEMLNYKITVNRGGLKWTRHGTHFIDKVLSLSDNSVVATAECDENTQQQIASFPSLGSSEDKGFGKQSSVKSSYSMFKTMDVRPITRSSTSTTTGTFYVKPSGDVEAAGYKTSSSFDSTRRDGDQWQHSKSDLSAADLEELKRLHGDDFFRFLPGNIQQGGSSSHYRKSSYSSTSSQNAPSLIGGYHHTGQVNDLQPTGGYSSYSKYEKHSSSAQPVSGQIYEPVLVHNYNPPATSDTSGYSSYHKQETVKTSGSSLLPSYQDRGDLKIYNSQSHIIPAQPQPPSSAGSSVRKTETYEFTSAPKTVVPLPPTTIYSGDIFRTSVRPLTPSTCSTIDFLGYKTPSQVDIVAIEKDVKELQCLAVLAENSLKAEIRTLKHTNADLVLRIEELEQQFRRFRDECRCH